MAKKERTKKEAIERVKKQRNWAWEVDRLLDFEAFNIAIKTLEDFDTLNEINLNLASENKNLKERIGKLIGYIDFLQNTAQGKTKSLNLLEKVVKGELEEIRAEGENFVQNQKQECSEQTPITEGLPLKIGEYKDCKMDLIIDDDGIMHKVFTKKEVITMLKNIDVKITEAKVKNTKYCDPNIQDGIRVGKMLSIAFIKEKIKEIKNI